METFPLRFYPDEHVLIVDPVNNFSLPATVVKESEKCPGWVYVRTIAKDLAFVRWETLARPAAE